MILVTGASGFIGGHLVDALVAGGEPVRCFVRDARRLCNPASVEIAPGDLVTGEGLDPALRDVDLVIHLAGVTKALRPADFYTGNQHATEVLARAVTRRGARLIHVSSLAAAGPSDDGTPVAEDAEPHPLTHYGRSKLEAERIVRALVPSAIIIRPPVVYGPRDTGVFQVLKPISKGWALAIGDGQSWFSAIYVKDLVEGLLTAAHAAVSGRTYYLSHPKPVSWTELAAAASRIMGRHPARILRIPPAAAWLVGASAELWGTFTGTPSVLSREKIQEARCRWWICDAHRAVEELRFAARTPLEEGLAATLSWYKEAGWIRY